MAHKKRKKKVLNGIGVAPGIAIGKVFRVNQDEIPIIRRYLNKSQIYAEIDRFKDAVARTEADFEKLKENIQKEFKDIASILDAYTMILKDHMLFGETIDIIKEKRINAEWALKQAVSKADQIFKMIDDEYIQSRMSDIHYTSKRVLQHLAGRGSTEVSCNKERVIIVAHDLSPADAALIQLEKTMALITDLGGSTSHTSIIARSLNIPAVVGLGNITSEATNGDIVIVDGISGKVIIDPEDETIASYSDRQYNYEKYANAIARFAHKEAKTSDGYKIKVEANIEMLEEVVAVFDNGAEGIGLYRTEFIYMNRDDLPSEDELTVIYRDLTELVTPKTVTIRTLDLGSDKFFRSSADKIKEINPALGLRSIRLCLKEKDVFLTQLRAILKASADYRNLKIIFPMVSGVEELFQAKAMLQEAKESLLREGSPFDENIPVGVMIEVPAAVAVADLLATEVDFFSIGTNDLIQYTLAIDRSSEYVTHLYEPLHPAILRSIKQVVNAGHRNNIPVSICGEMAGEPFYLPILLGYDLYSLSMTPRSIPKIKNMIRNITMSESRSYLETVLNLSTGEEVFSYLQDVINRRFPEFFSFMKTPAPLFS